MIPGVWFNKKMPSYQYRKSHHGDKTILRPSYLHNGISYTGKMASLYWIRALLLVNKSSYDGGWKLHLLLFHPVWFLSQNLRGCVVIYFPVVGYEQLQVYQTLPRYSTVVMPSKVLQCVFFYNVFKWGVVTKTAPNSNCNCYNIDRDRKQLLQIHEDKFWRLDMARLQINYIYLLSLLCITFIPTSSQGGKFTFLPFKWSYIVSWLIIYLATWSDIWHVPMLGWGNTFNWLFQDIL